MVSDERLKLLVIAHEEERHELARTPSVNVCSRHRRAGAKVFAIFWRFETVDKFKVERCRVQFQAFRLRLWKSSKNYVKLSNLLVLSVYYCRLENKRNQFSLRSPSRVQFRTELLNKNHYSSAPPQS